jgi:hypothetical protein
MPSFSTRTPVRHDGLKSFPERCAFLVHNTTCHETDTSQAGTRRFLLSSLLTTRDCSRCNSAKSVRSFRITDRLHRSQRTNHHICNIAVPNSIAPLPRYPTNDAILPSITTAFTGLRPVDARKAENPPAATPVQRLVIAVSIPESLCCPQLEVCHSRIARTRPNRYRSRKLRLNRRCRALITRRRSATCTFTIFTDRAIAPTEH